MGGNGKTLALDRPVAIDVFSGAGGMSLGFEMAGFDVAASVDSDPVHTATHRFNFPNTETIAASVEHVTGTELLKAVRSGLDRAGHLGEWDGRVDCLFGGPCCQSFSDMGRRSPEADVRTQLLDHFVRLIVEVRPRSFVMENVPGILRDHSSGVLERLLRAFEDAEYKMIDGAGVLLNARDYGVAQSRQRFFLIGVDESAGLSVPMVPEPSRAPRPTVFDAIGDLPNADEFSELLLSDEVLIPTHMLESWAAAQSKYARGFRRRSPNDLSQTRTWDRDLLTSSRRTSHAPKISRRYAGIAQGSRDPIGRLQRLNSASQAPTLRAGTGRDHGCFTSCRPIHYERARVITVREAARLHGFPDWFRFHTTKWHGFRQVGNSVPPPLAAAVASEVVATLGRDPLRDKRVLRPGKPELLRMSLVVAANVVGMDPCDLPRDVRRLKG